LGYFQAVLLGAVQGLTEFLPVSSSAHLILARQLLGWDADALGLAFDVACHAGTLLAVLTYFRHDLWAMARAVPDVFRATRDVPAPARLARMVVVGTVPVVIVGLLWASVIEERLRTPGVTAVTLTLGALGLFAADVFGRRIRGEAQVSWGASVAIGFAQAVALVPGVSRSGATITVGMLLGLRRDAAARFSFLLGVPAIMAAAGHAGIEVVKTGLTSEQAGVFAVGILVSGVVGYAAIGGLLRYLGKHGLAVFAWYRLAIALAVVIGMLGGRG
jgi:undecaprenyl-diphosphatase